MVNKLSAAADVQAATTRCDTPQQVNQAICCIKSVRIAPMRPRKYYATSNCFMLKGSCMLAYALTAIDTAAVVLCCAAASVGATSA
jgi:hypothetical protein